jgi:murein DD-endopeptidase MepM/ murein hydrolase activator NlpD
MARSVLKLALALTLLGPLSAAAAEPEAIAALPDAYTLDYPAAQQWCPPVRSTFVEATQTLSVVRGRRFRHQPNGGYGLPVQRKEAGQHLLHLGADLGWHQFGEPVFAAANGVVRRSVGPTPPDKASSSAKSDKSADDPPVRAASKSLMWGNLIVIEHRLETAGETKYLTTLYGHLGPDRRVQPGDIVTAGQQIGTIGRKHLEINGGYDPHVHFGIRQGRAAEAGAVLMHLRVDDQRVPLRIKSLDADQIAVELPAAAGRNVNVRIAGELFTFTAQDDVHVAPARILWLASFPDFPIIGYDLATTGWLDPIQTLRSFQADTNPAPFRLAPRAR